jgi:hypothetical protein
MEKKTNNTKQQNTTHEKMTSILKKKEEEEEEHLEPNAEDFLEDFRGWLTDEGLESLELFLTSSTPSSFVEHLKQKNDPLFSPQYEEDIQIHIPEGNEEEDELLIDGHVLHTPVIVDIDKDGHDDLLVPVSYYFDQ